MLAMRPRDSMTRFTETLRLAVQDDWDASVTHPFVVQLYDGTVPPAAMRRYLVQDHRFLDAFLSLLGGAMLNADTAGARLRFGRFVGMVSTDEDGYFLRAFDALGVTQAGRDAMPDSAATAGFKAIMREAGASGSYAVCLSVLNVAEWLYLDWASRAPTPLPDSFVHAEWITLHDNPDFRDFVGFLRDELDRVGTAEADRCHDFFSRAVRLERAFFDDALTA